MTKPMQGRRAPTRDRVPEAAQSQVVIEAISWNAPEVSVLLAHWKPAWTDNTASPHHRYLVARVAGEAIGVLEGTHDFSNWDQFEDYQHLDESVTGSYITAMYVAPASRRRGAGGALLDRFIADAQAHGSVAVVLVPDEDAIGRAARLELNRSRGFEFARYPGGLREPWAMVLPLT